MNKFIWEKSNNTNAIHACMCTHTQPEVPQRDLLGPSPSFILKDAATTGLISACPDGTVAVSTYKMGKSACRNITRDCVQNQHFWGKKGTGLDREQEREYSPMEYSLYGNSWSSRTRMALQRPGLCGPLLTSHWT
jgi:hypothetical protein